MKAEEKGLKFLTMEGKVKIPFFQRTYIWEENNWEDLLLELLDKEKHHNFLGAIILKQLPSVSGEPKQLEVIDGQQRLTTISILLKALYDSFSDQVKQNVKSEIFNILFYKKDYTSPDYDEIRIEHSLVDATAYQKVIKKSENIALDSIDINSHRILRCYKFFRTKLNEISEEDRKELLNRILNPYNKMLVVIDLDEKDDEQTIFDVLNTAGVRLTSAEIIKNALFKQAIEFIGKEDAIKLYKETWEKTFLKEEETVKYWETELATGRLKRQNIEILLHSIGVIEGFYDPDKHTLSDLSRLYKEKIKKFKSKDELKEFVEKIIEYARIYRENIKSFDKSDLLSFDDYKTRLLHIFDILEISTFYPFILFVMWKYENDENKQKILLNSLEKFVMQNVVAKVVPVKNYNKLCKQFVRKPDSINEELNKISKSSIEEGLKKVSNKEATLILFWIELYRRYKDLKCEIKELKYTYSLEHIMPIRWKEHWSFDKVPHPKLGELGEEEAEQDRNNKIYWIGNMTLLKSRLNSALKHLDFERKINGEGRKKGIRHYAELFITKEDIVDPFDQGDKVWNENKIEERTNRLVEEFIEIWRGTCPPNLTKNTM